MVAPRKGGFLLMVLLPFEVNFARKVPIELLHLRDTSEAVVIKAPWLSKLADDLRDNGLASPLLVIWEKGELRVKTGQNRLRCLRRLGWHNLPCIVVGPLPEGIEGTRLKTLEECQALLADGIVCNEQGKTLRINSAMVPEHMVYPTAPEPYFDIE